MTPLVVSFYTDEYAEFASTLIASCERFGYDCEVLAADLRELRDWRSRVAQKGPWLLAAMQRHDRPLLWLDADSEILLRPDLFDDPPFDFACCRAPCSGFFRSGTLYVRPAALPLLERCAFRCEDRPQDGHERNLTAAWDATSRRYRTRELPRGYNAVPSMLDDPQPPDPVFIISNHQSGGGYATVFQQEAVTA